MKKIISIFICIQIALFPTFLFAGVLAGTGWSIGDRVAKGASTIVNGTKNVVINGKNYIKTGTATITPTATQVAKVLARGAAGYALSVAVEQLLGAVDWVLDPANNRIVYTKQYGGTDPAMYKDRCIADIKALLTKHNIRLVYQTANGQMLVERRSDGMTCSTYLKYGDSARTIIATYPITGDDGGQKSIPLDVVASQVISNAESSSDEQIKVGAQAATTAAAADIVAEAEKDNTKARPIANQLDANATTKPADAAEAEKANEATGEAKPNTTNPDATDLSLEFPIFCDWAPTICEAAQTVINFPNTLTDWWETSNTKADSWASSISEAWASVKEWVTGEPDLTQDQTDLPIEEQTIDRDPSSFDTDYIVLGSQCPTFEPYTVEVGPISKTLSMDLSPLCDFAAQVRPAIIGMSYLTAAGIVVAAIRET